MSTTDELVRRIGTSIRHARRDAGLTQQQLGELAGLSDRTIREIEMGTSNPGLRSVITVITVLGLSLRVEK